MTVKQLKKLLATAPDDTLVVTGGDDHSYIRTSSAAVVDAEDSDYGISEYYGEEHAAPGSRKIRVLVII